MKTGITAFDKYVAVRNKSNFPMHRLVANTLLARPPEFVIIGTGRSGTTFIAKHFQKGGVRISHEQYFTHKGPYLRNPGRDWRTRGEASWLAVPYLPHRSMPAIHQVRHPHAVIASLFKIGFFDSRYYAEHKPFADFARRHFTFSDDPLQSSLRWYLEWNQRCEQITDRRYRIEHVADSADRIEAWLGLEIGLRSISSATDINTRAAVFDVGALDIAQAIRQFPEYPALEVMCERYGYVLG